jgi:hypothetical protein
MFVLDSNYKRGNDRRAVHGPFREAVIGPAFTPGSWLVRTVPLLRCPDLSGPFTGLLHSERRLP